jgi:ABC-2 type transport system ATP-binding protein
MAVLADELVVIGRGRLVANGAVADFLAASGLGTVELTSPDLAIMTPVLEERGGTIIGTGESVTVTGLDAATVGDVAHELGARLHQLVTRQASLEEAFLSATGDDEEFRGITE